MGDERACESRYRRKSAVGRREPRGLLRFTDAEWAVIVQAAERESMRPGAWAQHVAYESARRRGGESVLDRELVESLLSELAQQRRVLTNVGGNLNDVAKVANATGAIENAVAAQTVLRLVRNVVLGTDEVIRRVRAELLG